MASRRLVALTAILTTALASPAAAAGTVPAAFVSEGPNGIFGTAAQSEGTEPWSGAVTAVVPDPAHAGVALIATVNGGIWRTTDLGAATPRWTPESDHAASLSIASLSFDPTVGAGDRVAIAGIGHRSAFGGAGGPLTGLLKSTDGGRKWTPVGARDLAGADVSGASIRGKVIAATSRGTGPGLWVSTDGGAKFKPALAGPAFDLVGDPRRPARLYAALGGAHGGVFRSDDDGRTWTRQGGGPAALARTAANMRLAVGRGSAVWVAVAGPAEKGNALDGLFHTTGTSTAWQPVDVAPQSDPVLSVNPGGQAGVHLAVAGDPADASVVYVGGDHLPEGGAGQILACDASRARGRQCRRVARQGASDGSAPHADIRSLAFGDTGHLLLGGDGGVYRDDDPANPAAADSRWTSLNGRLDAIEAHSCAWDDVQHTAMCGNQDAGTAGQRGPGRLGWDELGRFDGNDLAIADGASGSTAYYSAHALDEFRRRVCVSATICFTTTPALTVAGTSTSLRRLPNVATYDPIAADGSCPTRLAIFAGGLFESADGAQTFRLVAGLGSAKVKALAYAGTGCADPARRLYVATKTGLFVRTGAGALTRVAAYKGAAVALAVDPGDTRSVWVASATTVTHVRNGRATDVTGDLGPLDQIRAVAFIPGGAVLAGADNGLWAMDTAHPGTWRKVSGRLPNAVVASLEFDPGDDVLLAGTLGRGAWKLARAREWAR